MRYPLLLLIGSFLPATAPAADIALTTRVSGVVEEVLVKTGQRVKKGTVLLRLDKTIYQAQVDEAGAEGDRLRAEEAEAKRDLDRAQELYNRTVSSTTELDAAKLRYTRAKSALTVAEARLTIARKNLMDTELRAPMDGLIATLPAAPGVVVTAECQPRMLVGIRRAMPRNGGF